MILFSLLDEVAIAIAGLVAGAIARPNMRRLSSALVDMRATVWEQFSQFKRENRSGAFGVESYQTVDIDDEPLPPEDERREGESDVPSASSTAAVCARIRWLVEQRYGPDKGFIKEFADTSRLDYDRARSILKSANAPSRTDMLLIKRFFRVDADFLLYGEIEGLRYDVASVVQGNSDLRDKMVEAGVDLPDYLRLAS